MSRVQRGEIWWLEEPHRKARPVCVLTRESAIPVVTQLTVIPATSRARGIPTEVDLTTADGMPKPCVLTTDNILTVPKSYLTRKITRLHPSRMREICSALAIATGCS